MHQLDFLKIHAEGLRQNGMVPTAQNIESIEKELREHIKELETRNKVLELNCRELCKELTKR